MTLQRSCWKIPKAAMTVTDADGTERPLDGDLVIYDASPHFVYAMCATWDRPDIAAAGGKREDLSKPVCKARFLRTTVRRVASDPAEPRIDIRVKSSNILASDDVIDADVPFVLFAGDAAADILSPEMLAEASERIAAENP